MVGYIDLDGTLLDTRTALYEAYSDAAAAYGLCIEQDFFNQSCFGYRSEDFLCNFTSDAAVINGIRASKRLNYEKYYDKIRVNDDLVSQIIMSENDRNYIFTNVEGKLAVKLLEVFGLREYFPFVISIDQFKIPKPSQESIDYALKFLENDKIAIFYDDNVDLIQSVRKRGLRGILIEKFI